MCERERESQREREREKDSLFVCFRGSDRRTVGSSDWTKRLNKSCEKVVFLGNSVCMPVGIVILTLMTLQESGAVSP